MRQIRELIALAMLAVSSYTDMKEKSIYPVPLAICTAGGVALSVTSYAFAPSMTGGDILLQELLYPLVAGIMVIIIVKAGKHYIGAGDGYLTAALWMVLGLRAGIYAEIAGLLFSFAVSACLLISGRGRCHRLIPFAPFILAGYLAVLINEIY